MEEQSKWVFTHLPFKRFWQETESGEWGRDKLSPVLPTPVKLGYLGRTYLNKALLFENVMPVSRRDIYTCQPYRKYYLVWLDDHVMIDLVLKLLNKEIWITESYNLGGMYGEVLGVESPKNPEGDYVDAVTISGVLLGNEEPEDLKVYQEFMRLDYLEGYKKEGGSN